jgi:hypothetical protein
MLITKCNGHCLDINVVTYEASYFELVLILYVKDRKSSKMDCLYVFNVGE